MRRHQHPHEAPKTDGLGAEIGPHERLASSRRIAFVEDEIDHGQHRSEPRGQIVPVGHRIRNARVANLAFRAHEPLRHRCRRHEKRARDLVRFEAAQRAQRQRDLRLERKRRVAASEDQPKAIVGDFVRVVIRVLRGKARPGRGVRFKFFLEQGPAPDAVDGLVPGCLDDPCTWELRDAGGPPLVHSGRKGFLRRLFGQVEVADEPDQRGNDPAPVGAIDRVNDRVGVRGHAQL